MAATLKHSDSRRDWSRQLEAASLRKRDEIPHDAVRCFDKELTPLMQMSLVRELVKTRAAELTLAYQSVVMVAAGHKKQSDALGRQKLTRKACVVFVVRNKWDKSLETLAKRQLIPARLLTYATLAERRVLCAVPTDVQHESDFYGILPQSQRAVFPADKSLEFGTITCVVRLRESSHVLSCRHVLSPVPEVATSAVTSGTGFAQLLSADYPPGGARIGASESFAGPLLETPSISFDAQLGSIAESARPLLRTLMQEMPLSLQEPFLATPERFDELRASRGFEILVPDNHPDAGMKLRPTYAASFDIHLDAGFHFSYRVRINGKDTTRRVSHWELLKFKIAAQRSTLPGDSGSPVVTWNPDGSCTLVAMHIAGAKGASVSYAIPSWQLFAASNYLGLSAGESIVPINL
jgi:hypothetical protein